MEGKGICILLLVLSCIGTCFSIALPRPVKAVYLTWKDLNYGNIATQVQDITDAGFNAIILSFYANGTAYDSTGVWAGLSDNYKAEAKAYLKSKNAVLLAGFKITNYYNSYSHNATELGTQLASWAVSQSFDGIDLYFQDIQQSFVAPQFSSTNQTVDWIVDLTKAASSVLGGDRIITIAAQPAFFGPIGSSQTYAGPSGGFVGVYQQVQELVAAVIIYYFAQDSPCTNSYERLFVIGSSGGCLPGTSVQEIGLAGIPLSKIVIALGITTDDTVASLFLSGADTKTYVENARNDFQWDGGVAGWQWQNIKAPQWIQAIYPASVSTSTAASTNSGAISSTSTTSSTDDVTTATATTTAAATTTTATTAAATTSATTTSSTSTTTIASSSSTSTAASTSTTAANTTSTSTTAKSASTTTSTTTAKVTSSSTSTTKASTTIATSSTAAATSSTIGSTGTTTSAVSTTSAGISLFASVAPLHLLLQMSFVVASLITSAYVVC